MLNTVWATVRNGQIELMEQADLHEGATLLVTLLPDHEFDFWLRVSEVALDDVWGNEEDDIYAELLAA